MRIGRLLLLAAVAGTGIVAANFRSHVQAQADRAAREEAYRANNIGVALLEQYAEKGAPDEFRRALKLNPKLTIAQINLAIALLANSDFDAALREAKIAQAMASGRPQPYYVLGLIARVQNRTADAFAAFKRVLEIDPRDAATNINLGQLYKQERDYPKAIASFRAALAVEPYNTTALYGLGLSLNQSGQRDEGREVMAQFQKVKAANYGVELGSKYLEQGRYAEAITSTGAESDLVDTAMPDVTFIESSLTGIQAQPAESGDGGVRVVGRAVPGEWNDGTRRELAASLAGGVTLFDYDGDGDLDVFEVTATGQRLYRNDGGKLVDVTDAAGLAKVPPGTIGIGAVAGDCDNDGKPDLLVLRYGGLTLYHNDGGKFSDVTSAAGIPKYPYLALSLALVDLDHDGDLDIFVAGYADLAKAPASAAGRQPTIPDDLAAAPNLLLRNDGSGKFTDVTAEAKLTGGKSHAVAVVPTDFDNHRDVDLFVLNYNDRPILYSNQRDGSFRDVAADVGLNIKGAFTCVAAGDFNKDGYTDFFLGKADGAGVLATSDGQTRFTTTPAPGATEGAIAAQFVDYDNDGLLDLVTASRAGFRVFRNLGTKWDEVSERAVAKPVNSIGTALRGFASGDIDCDGDTDLLAVLSTGDLKLARNDGGNKNRSLKVQLAGQGTKGSNRTGIGSKIEVRAGSLGQKLETSSASPAPAPADIIFGLGNRSKADAVRVLWPSGIVQAETELPGPRSAADGPDCKGLPVNELQRKSSSCPFLYAWNGERFEFVTDFMGGGEMGYWEAPGRRNVPDPDEYVRIREDQLKENDGRLELRVTNELEEVLYVDRLQLIAVSHPGDAEVYPNEGMAAEPRPYKLWVTRNAHPPVSAFDDRGNDVFERIAKLDRKYPDAFGLSRFRGYAEEHALTLNLGPASSGRTLLLLTGWTDYAYSSDNVAASQARLSLTAPALQVKDRAGRWQTVIEDIGIPVGRPQTVTVDLTGKFLSDNREVRILTNMRVYWDQILVDTSGVKENGLTTTMLAPMTADLHWRGFSAAVTPDGREPFGYDYTRVSKLSPWKTMPGRYTREGDVRPLLAKTDDVFVVSRPGDEIALEFDATRLPRLPRGWKRTYLLYADGFSKEMDINSASPDAVAPLPFHGMKEYPYEPRALQARRVNAARRRITEQYNTRVVHSTLPPIETVFATEAVVGSGGARR